MENIKTEIYLEKSLFDKVDAFAHEIDVSSSRVFVLAVEEFLRRQREKKKLIEAINAAYDDLPDQQEQILRNKMRNKHRRLVEGQW